MAGNRTPNSSADGVRGPPDIEFSVPNGNARLSNRNSRYVDHFSS